MNSLGFQLFVDVQRGKCRVTGKVEPNLRFLLACDHRDQDISPAVSTSDIAGTQTGPLQVAHMVEQEQQVITGAAEVAVVGRAFLTPKVGLTLESMSRTTSFGGLRL